LDLIRGHFEAKREKEKEERGKGKDDYGLGADSRFLWNPGPLDGSNVEPISFDRVPLVLRGSGTPCRLNCNNVILSCNLSGV